MAIFDGFGLIFVGLVLFWVWALYDIVTSDPNQVRNLPKVLWLVVIVLLSPFVLDIGPILWFFLGRPVRTSATAGHPNAARRVRRPAEPQPEADLHTHRVVTDRRSAELDRMLEEWERTRRDEASES